jgi:CheY-like chemotaxis protein
MCAVIVDDNRDAAATLAALLAVMGCEAVFVTDPRQALGEVERTQPRLVFLDIGMPHLNGYELARLIRLTFPDHDIAIVGISGYADHADHKERAWRAGFDELLIKPPDLGRIEMLVQRVLQ